MADQGKSTEGLARYDKAQKKPTKKSMPTTFVREFRLLLDAALSAKEDTTGKTLGKCIGVYAFYDYDGEPIYVGQTTEDFATRIGRHLRGQRSDTLAYRILDPFEVAEMELYPTEDLRALPNPRKDSPRTAAMNRVEYSVYLRAIANSKYQAILNEKIPPVSERVDLPKAYRFPLVPEGMREDREHPDIRIARRAETLARVAAVARERGEVSPGLRRVIVVQAVRLADLAAARLAYAEGRVRPPATSIDVQKLVGSVIKEFSDPTGSQSGAGGEDDV